MLNVAKTPDTLIRVILAIVQIVPALVAVFGFWRYFDEKNRVIYERRLNEVYAPLYGHLVKQETFRLLTKGFGDCPSFDEMPIITVTSTKDATNEGLTPGDPIPEGLSFIDERAFIRTLHDTNKGLARPKLLLLIKQFETLSEVRDKINPGTPLWFETIDRIKVVGRELFEEIIDGYESSIRRLSLDGNDDMVNLKQMRVE